VVKVSQIHESFALVASFLRALWLSGRRPMAMAPGIQQGSLRACHTHQMRKIRT
jgi:hypothetical protein